MNALVSIDSIGVLTPATVFAPGGVEGILSKIETEVRAIDRDISTHDGRENVKSLAYKVARSKTALDDMGKELVSGIKAQAATIDAERRTIRDRLDALKEEVRGPLTAWETAEADRIALHESALVFLAEAARFAAPPSAATVRERIKSVDVLDARDWQEFAERGAAGINEALAALETLLAAAEQAERDAAELAELRRLKAEREEADRQAAEAAQATEQARLVAEAKAEREAKFAERIERERAEAAAAAIERENRRVAEAQAKTEADRLKREADAKHRAEVEAVAIESLALHIPRKYAEKAVAAIAALAILRINITY